MGKKALSAALVAAVITSGPAWALSEAELKKFDANGNNKFDRGDELSRLIEELKKAGASSQLTTAQDFRDSSKPGGLPIDKLLGQSLAERVAKDCKVKQKFFLQETVSDMSLLHPTIVKTAKVSGAAFTLNHDGLSSITSWSAKGSVAWLLPWTRPCIDKYRDNVNKSAVLTGRAMALYLDFAGNGNSTATGTSNLTFGLQTVLQLSGGKSASIHEISYSPYYRTDFDGKAKIYGFRAAWKPVNDRLRLAAYPINKVDGAWWWDFSTHADYRKVEAAGRSGLTAGSESAWLGAKIGITKEFGKPKAGQFFAEANYQYFHDFKSGGSAELLGAKLGTYLDEDKRGSLVLSYDKGKDYIDLKPVEKLSLKLTFAF